MAKKVFVEGNTLRVAEEEETDEGYEDNGIYNESNPPIREERIDGVVYSMSAAPYSRHAMVVSNIFGLIHSALKGKPCMVFSEGLGFHYHRDTENKGKKGDCLQPDVIIACDKSKMLEDGYYGASKFIAEVTSPSTAKYDKTLKFKAYEGAGVDEYWIVNPNGTLDIYYLIDGHYELQESWTIADDAAYDNFNANEVIALRCFPDIKMTLGEIFE